LPVLAALAPAVNEIQLRESQVKLHAVIAEGFEIFIRSSC